MSDIIETAGDFRVSIMQDTYADAPDHDGQGYVFTVDWSYSQPHTTEAHRDSGDPAPSFDVAEAYNRLGDWQRIERWLRMFHDVVSFDYAELSRSGPTYVFVVTRAQAVSWGLNPDDDDKSYSDGESQADIARRAASDTLSTWRQWAEGDVWSYVVERRETWTNAAGDTRETWEHVDSCGGFYGQEYAEEEARTALKDAAGE